jgi:hypothetical protein
VGEAQLGEVAEVRVQAQVRVQAGEQRSAVDGVYARLSWGLFSNLVWRGQWELAHLMGPVRVPVGEVLLPLEEADIGTVRVSDQEHCRSIELTGGSPGDVTVSGAMQGIGNNSPFGRETATRTMPTL